MKKLHLLITASMFFFVGCRALNGPPERTPPAVSTEPSISSSSSAATAIPTVKPVEKPPVQSQTQPPKKPDDDIHYEHHGVLTLQWNPVPGASWYNLYYDTKPGVTKKSHKKITGITSTTHTVTGLSPDTTYYFVVTAANATTESAESSEISGKTKKSKTTGLFPEPTNQGWSQLPQDKGEENNTPPSMQENQALQVPFPNQKLNTLFPLNH